MTEKILIVDKEPDMLLLLSRLIRESTPYESMVTNNPIEAIELVKKDWISLVITEIKMPLIDGMQLLEEVKRINADIPVIITASYGTVEHALEAVSKGAFNFIMKPFRKEQMLFSIDKALQMAKLKKENRMLKVLATSDMRISQIK